MVVKVSKPEINVREELADLRKPTGVAGEAMLRAETPQEQFNLIGAGRRNMIINGAMQVAQRGTSVTGTSVAGYKTVDRWSLSLDGDNDNLVVDIQQSGDAPDGFSKSHKITVATPETAIQGDEQISITQAIEAQDLASLAYGSSAAKEMTLSFWVKSSIAANYAVQFYTEDSGKQFVAPYTINNANTWEYKTVVVPPLTTNTITLDNGVGILIYWGLSAGPDRTSGTGNTSSWGTWNKANTFSGMTGNWMAVSGATFQITGVQLELGKVATPFEHRSFGEELALCQRYYWQTESWRGGTYAYDQIGQGFIRTTNTNDSPVTIQAPFPVPMRVRPAVGPSNVDGAVNFAAQVANTGATIDTIVGTWTSGVRMAWLDFDLASNPFSVGQAVSVYCNGGSHTDIQFDAEL